MPPLICYECNNLIQEEYFVLEGNSSFQSQKADHTLFYNKIKQEFQNENLHLKKELTTLSE